jgi:hypothetical protein
MLYFHIKYIVIHADQSCASASDVHSADRWSKSVTGVAVLRFLFVP